MISYTVKDNINNKLEKLKHTNKIYLTHKPASVNEHLDWVRPWEFLLGLI